MDAPRVFWDLGTAYDLFMSLAVLHEPAEFGVRRAWTAGVRARIPDTHREILEQGLAVGHVPLHWIYRLPDPKDSVTVLWALGRLDPSERLPALALSPMHSERSEALLRGVAERGSWGDQDRKALRTAWMCEGESEPPTGKLARVLDTWSHSAEFGERFLEALRAYIEVFFGEEELRIRPALESGLGRAQDLATRLSFPDLLEDLSQGLRLAQPPYTPEWVFVPSFWSSPLVVMGKVNADRAIWLFGARPLDASLVPGEVVPDAMLRALKALSDPTRLRIMRYLTAEPLAPSELARRLRLRVPTVTHHLRALRLAGLVQISLGKGKEAKRYAARTEAIRSTCASLESFMGEATHAVSGASEEGN